MRQIKNTKLQNELIYIRKLINNQRFNDAQKVIEQLSDYEDNYLLKFEIGYLKYQQKQYREAFSIFETLSNKSNKNYAIFYMAKIKLLEEKYDEANKLFKIIVDNNYKNKNYALLELAKIEKYQENYQSALEYLERIEYEDNQLKNATLIEKANIYTKMNLYEKSNQIIFESIKTISEKNLLDKALTTSSINFLKLKQYDESLRILNRISNKNTQTKTIQAKCLFFQNKFISSRKILEELYENLDIKHDVNYFEIIRYLSKTYMKTNKIKEALKILNQNVKKYNDFEYLLGLAYLKNKNIEEAKKHFFNAKEDKYYQYDAIKQLLFIDIKEENYIEAYKKYRLLNENDYFEQNEITKNLKNNIYIILSSHLEIPKANNNLYSTRQVYNYQDIVLKNYIIESLNIQMDVNKYLEIIINNLNDDTYIENNLFDHYIIENPEKKFKQDFIKISTIPNTKKILFIQKCDQFGYDAYETEEVEDKETKYESQIEKFNKRYAKKLKK